MPASVIVLFAARFCVTAMRGPPVDGDLAWQRWLGEQILASGTLPTKLGAETFSAAGSPWLPQEWLFGILAAVAQRFSAAPAFALAVALCAVIALVLSARRATAAGASPLATALCVLFTGIALIDAFGVRAQVAGWPLLAAFNALLERDASWLLCGAVVILWSNLHAGAVIAPFLAAASTAGLAVRDRALSRDVVRTSIVAVAALFATAMNPFGFGLIAYAVGLLHNPIKGYIREWQPPTFSDASFVWGALPLLAGVAVWALSEGRRSPQRLCVVAVGLALMCSAARNIAVFAVIAAPYAALGFGRVLRRTGAAQFAQPPALALSAALCVTVLAGVTASRLWRVPHAPDGRTRLIAWLAASPDSHRLLCQDYAWCGAAVGARHIRVFLDGRADPYPRASGTPRTGSHTAGPVGKVHCSRTTSMRSLRSATRSSGRRCGARSAGKPARRPDRTRFSFAGARMLRITASGAFDIGPRRYRRRARRRRRYRAAPYCSHESPQSQTGLVNRGGARAPRSGRRGREQPRSR